MLNLTLSEVTRIVDGQLQQGDGSIPVRAIETDTRLGFRQNTLFVALKGENYDGHRFVNDACKKGACAAIVHQDMTPAHAGFALIRVKNTLRALQELARHHRESCQGKFIAITGSNGKTIAKDCCMTILGSRYHVQGSPGSYNSQVGVALSLLRIDPEADFNVIEAGISQIGEMPYLERMIQPDYGLLINVGVAHFEGFGSRQIIAVEKLKLFHNLPPEGWLLAPTDAVLTQALLAKIPTRCYQLGTDLALPSLTGWEGIGTNRSRLALHFPQKGTWTIDVHIDSSWQGVTGTVMMAVSTAYLLGVEPDTVCQALAQFNPPLNRLEIWKSQHGAFIVNDTYNAEPISVNTCLQVFDQYPTKRKIFIFGGMTELGTRHEYAHRIVGEEAARKHVDLLLTVGDLPHPTKIAFRTNRPSAQMAHFKDVSEATNYIESQAGSQDVIVVKGPRRAHFDRIVQRFKTLLSNTVFYINLPRIKQNIITFKEHIGPDVKMLLMIKALAYGADAIAIARYLENENVVDYFGVAYTSEAIELRQSGITSNILVMLTRPEDAEDIVRLSLTAVVFSSEMARALSDEALLQHKTARVHLKVDTGMGRLGVFPEQVLPLAQTVESHDNLEIEGIMTHFSVADDPSEDSFTEKQIERFQRVIELLQQHDIDPPLKHAAATAGIARHVSSHFSMVRLGLGAYGLYPSDAVKQAITLQCPVALMTRIAEIKNYPTGTPLSYGKRFYTSRDTRVAILPIGYHDGLRRSLSNQGYVLVDGNKAPIVGTICMDFTLVDITDVPQARVGDEVLIFGEKNGHSIRIETVAEMIGTISYEILCTLSARIQRLYVME